MLNSEPSPKAPAAPHARLLIATDGSLYSLTAVRTALDIVERNAVDITVVSVAETPVTYAQDLAWGGFSIDPETCQALWDESENLAKSALERAREVIAARGIDASYLLRIGSPTEEVLAVARELQPALVVLGSHGRNPLGRLFLGSVSEGVLHRWHGTTMIVHLPESTNQAESASRPVTQAFRVRDVMTSRPVCASISSSLQDAAKLMREADAGLLPVLDGSRLVGVITDRDIAIHAIALGVDPACATVDAFKRAPVRTIAPDATTAEAAKQMEKHQIRRLLVVEAGELVGVVSLGDLAETLPSEAEEVLVEVSRSFKTLAHQPPWEG